MGSPSGEMTKYAVEIDDEKTKTAEYKRGDKCPKCGEEIGESVNFAGPWCPNCGTEPFEKRP